MTTTLSVKFIPLINMLMNYLRKFCLPFHVNNYCPVTLSQITIGRTSDVFGERGLGVVSCQSKFFSSQSTGSYPCIIAVQAVDVLHYRNRIQRMRHTFRKGQAYLFWLFCLKLEVHRYFMLLCLKL